MTHYSENLRSLAKSWNNLDVRFMENQLSDNVTYRSYWKEGKIEGREKFLSYMNLKFAALRFTKSFKMISVNAELVQWKDESCVLLNQITEESIREVLISVDSVNDKMRYITINEVPDNREEIVLSGDIPM